MELSRAVLALHNRGVTIRVLSDKDYTAIVGSQIGVLRRAGKGNESLLFLSMYLHAACGCETVFLCMYLQIQAEGCNISTHRNIIGNKKVTPTCLR